MPLVFTHERRLSADEFTDLLRRSTLGERRPIDQRERIEAMLEHGNLLCTAWQGERLVGVARSLTDFAFCCYLSDLAVDVAHQRQGIGVELLRYTQAQLHPQCKLILLAAPAAEAYYPRVGMTLHRSAWTTPARPLLRNDGDAGTRS